jgi:hypothetical protein
MNKKAIQNVDGDNNIVAGNNLYLTVNQLTTKLPSTLGKILPALSKVIFEDEVEKSGSPNLPYEIESKIEHNNLKLYREWLECYNEYGKTVDTLYEKLDDNKPGSRKRILMYLTSLYSTVKLAILREKGAKDSKDMDVIRENADLIFENTAAALKESVTSCGLEGLSIEDIDISIKVIVCHGFINCKILEKVS